MAASKFFLLVALAALSAPSSSARPQSTKFIKTSCNSTSYPSVCYSSLSKYASVIQENPVRMAQVATKVSLSTLKSAASKASNLYQKSLSSPNNNKTRKALKDCTELLKDAKENTQYSLSELKKLNKTVDNRQETVWLLANVQTYMSAALTKEETCTDGLKEMGAVVKTVSAKVAEAKQHTSNALGLVNRLR